MHDQRVLDTILSALFAVIMVRGIQAVNERWRNTVTAFADIDLFSWLVSSR